MAATGTYSNTDLGLLAIRGMVGFVMFYHGAQKLFSWFGGKGISGFAGFLKDKGFPLPELNAYIAGGAETFGGLMLMAGLLARIVSIPLAITMLVAFFVGHGGVFNAMKGGGEYALTLAVVIIGLGLTGPGRLSVDGLVFRKGARS
jgi:putative oxidoreductase